MRLKDCDVCGQRHAGRCKLLDVIGTHEREVPCVEPMPVDEWNQRLTGLQADFMIVDDPERPTPPDPATVEKVREWFERPVQLIDGVVRPVPWSGIRRVIIHPDGHEEPVPDDAPWTVKGHPVFLASGDIHAPAAVRREPGVRERFFTWLGDRAQDFAQWCYGRAM